MAGRTKKMIEEAAASDAPRVVVVAHSMEYARELARRIEAKAPGKAVTPTTPARVERGCLRGTRVPVFIDHHALACAYGWAPENVIAELHAHKERT